MSGPAPDGMAKPIKFETKLICNIGDNGTLYPLVFNIRPPEKNNKRLLGKKPQESPLLTHQPFAPPKLANTSVKSIFHTINPYKEQGHSPPEYGTAKVWESLFFFCAGWASGLHF